MDVSGGYMKLDAVSDGFLAAPGRQKSLVFIVRENGIKKVSKLYQNCIVRRVYDRF